MAVMVDKANTFVVKERIEGLEDKFEKVLKIDGLAEMAKDVTSKVLAEALDASKTEIRDTAKDVVKEAKEFILSEKESINVDMDKRLDSARSEFQKALVEHVEAIENRLAKAERLLKIAIAISLASAAWSGLSGFLG